ncbi:MAG: energy transducer TonB [Bacteroidota bacterium]
MESKKHPKADLERKRPIFFQVGLAVALSISLMAFEWQTFYELTELPTGLELDEVYEQEIVVTLPKPKVEEPKPKVDLTQPPKVVDEPLVEEFDPTPEVPDDAVVDTTLLDDMLADVEFPEEKIIEERIWTAVESMPHFCECRSMLSEKDKGSCTYKAIVNHLNKNVKYPRRAREARIEGTVYVTFVVNKSGNVEDASILRGVHPLLDKEALRVVSGFPCYVPGKQQNRSVNVSFNMPIKFKLN